MNNAATTETTTAKEGKNMTIAEIKNLTGAASAFDLFDILNNQRADVCRINDRLKRAGSLHPAHLVTLRNQLAFAWRFIDAYGQAADDWADGKLAKV
jgi:hypothetical protein